MTKNMTLEQSLAVLSTKELTEEDKKLILMENGLIASENEKTIATNASTFSLSAYTAGIKANTKAWIANMVANPKTWIVAVGLAIYGVVKAIDYYNGALQRQKEKLEDVKQSFEEAQSAVESVNQELESAKNRIEELQSLPSLSFVEAAELEKLKETVKELSVAADIAEKIAKREKEELSDENEKTYNQEYGNYNTTNTSSDVQRIFNESLDMGDDGARYISSQLDTGNISATIAGLLYAKKQLNEAEEEYASAVNEENFELADYFKSVKQDAESQVEFIEEILEDSIQTLSNYQQTAILAGDTDSEYYKSLIDNLKLIYEYTDPANWNTIEVNDILNSDELEVTKEQLVSLAKSGKLDKNTISQYKNLNTAISNSNLILKDGEDSVEKFIEQIYSLAGVKPIQELIDIFGQDAVNKLTSEELQIALTISTEEADKAIEEEKKKVETELQSLSKEGNVDLTIRPVIDSSAMQAAGWDVEDGSIATTFTQGEFIWQGDEENGQYVYVHYTPILPDGTILTPDELTDYLYGILEGSEDILGSDDKGLVLKVDTDLNIPEEDIKKFQNGEGSTQAIYDLILKTGEWDDKVHDVQEQYYDTGDGIGYIETALDGLIEKHSELGKGNETAVSTITSSVQQIASQLEPQFAKLGEAYKSIFTTDGFTLEDVDNPMLEDLCTSFAEIEEEVGVAFDSTELESFFGALIRGNSTAEQVQQAFNDLATSYFYSTDTLSNLNEETAEAIEKQLEELGVVNAHEVVYAQLRAEEEALALQKQYLALTSNELIKVTSAEAIGFLNEAGASEAARKYLMLLTAQEQIFNNQDLNVTEKIARLQELAQKYGDTALAASVAAKMEEASKSAATGGSYSFQDAFNEAKAEFEAAARTVEINFSDIDTSGASKAGSDAGDAYLEAFEEELADLQDLRDRGVIDEKEYLDRLRLLYIRYFADRKEYLDEYNKYEREYLEGMKSLYDSALSAITKLMGNKIDAVEEEKEVTITALEEERDARLEVIDAQKEQLEAEIDLIDEQIEAKQAVIDSIQDEIDKMREANEERKRATDLQKAQYDLERMMNQRTQLVYQGGQMVYRADEEGIRDAREAVDDAKLEIEIAAKEKEIALIEDEIDLLEKQKDAIQDQIDALDKQADSIEKYYSKMISQQEKYYDSLIKSMEQQKSKWEELAEVQEVAEAYSAIQQVFGELGYTVEDVLNGSSGAFEDFKEKYISLMSDLNSNSSFTDGLSYATGVAKEDLGSFLEKTQEVGQGLDELSTKGEGLDTVSSKMDSASTSASGLKTSTDGVNENLSGISESLNTIPSSEGIEGWVTGFTNLGEAIKGVAEALGVTKDGTVGSLVSALKDISEVSLGTEEEGIIGQFGLLKKAVDDVSSAISGGTGGGQDDSGDASNSKSASMSSGAVEGESGGLIGAIEDIGTTTTDTLGESGEEEGGTGVIGKFTELKNAVDLVTQSIGTGEEEEGEETTTLVGALQKQYEKAIEVLPEEKTLFDELLSSIQACVSALIEMASAIETMPAISAGGGISVTGHADGTVGHAFANGTGKYKGLARDEKLAVRSEYGQPELTVYPDGKAELTTTPTVSSLPKGTEILNEEQTKKALNNEGEIVGNAYGTGTQPDGSYILPDGNVCTPLPEDHPVNMFLKKWKEKNMEFNESMTTPMHRIQDHVSEMVRGINNISTNNNRQQVNIGDINVTCTGVTSKEVMQQVGSALKREFSGMALEALQESNITR